MALSALKLVSSDYTGYKISELQDNPANDGLSAAQVKARFDALVVSVIGPRIGQIIDALLAATDGASGADQIGSTAISGVTGTTVQAQLESLKALYDTVSAGTVESIPDDSITDAKLSGAEADIKARFAAFEASHEHTMADITDLATALEEYAALVHTHAISSITGLQAALDGKSAVSHLHSGTYPTIGTVATAAQGTKADAALPATSYTAADVLAKLLTVDGAGSGVDADTLDGKQLAALVLAENAGNSIHMDTVKTTSVLGMYGRAESPDGSSSIGVLITNAYSTDWIAQWWYPISSANPSGYRRNFYSGTTWTSWDAEVKTIYSSSTPTVVNGAMWLKPV